MRCVLCTDLRAHWMMPEVHMVPCMVLHSARAVLSYSHVTRHCHRSNSSRCSAVGQLAHCDHVTCVTMPGLSACSACKQNYATQQQHPFVTMVPYLILHLVSLRVMPFCAAPHRLSLCSVHTCWHGCLEACCLCLMHP